MTAAPDRKRVHVWISGTVQGVVYRDSTRREAERLGVSGWVRNLPDGRVEGAFEGDPEAVDALVAWCWQGSPAAQVDDVAVQAEAPEGLSRFEVRR